MQRDNQEVLKKRTDTVMNTVSARGYYIIYSVKLKSEYNRDQGQKLSVWYGKKFRCH